MDSMGSILSMIAIFRKTLHYLVDNLGEFQLAKLFSLELEVTHLQDSLRTRIILVDGEVHHEAQLLLGEEDLQPNEVDHVHDGDLLSEVDVLLCEVQFEVSEQLRKVQIVVANDHIPRLLV
jgi:hypothetical protein